MSDGFWVSIGIAIAGVVLSTGGSIASIVYSLRTAKKYGDRAGTQAAIAHEEKQAAKARRAALKALIAHVKLAQSIAQANTKANTGTGLPRMPTAAFETAFVSSAPRLDGSTELVQAVSEYLSQAYAVNSLVDQFLVYLGGPGSIPSAQGILPNITAACENLSGPLAILGECLQAEHDQSDA